MQPLLHQCCSELSSLLDIEPDSLDVVRRGSIPELVLLTASDPKAGTWTGSPCMHDVQTMKGSVNVAENGGEYGRMKIRTTQDSELFSYETEHTQTVWMSHGDEVVKLPEGFRPVATSEQVS